MWQPYKLVGHETHAQNIPNLYRVYNDIFDNGKVTRPLSMIVIILYVLVSTTQVGIAYSIVYDSIVLYSELDITTRKSTRHCLCSIIHIPTHGVWLW